MNDFFSNVYEGVQDIGQEIYEKFFSKNNKTKEIKEYHLEYNDKKYRKFVNRLAAISNIEGNNIHLERVNPENYPTIINAFKKVYSIFPGLKDYPLKDLSDSNDEERSSYNYMSNKMILGTVFNGNNKNKAELHAMYQESFDEYLEATVSHELFHHAVRYMIHNNVFSNIEKDEKNFFNKKGLKLHPFFKGIIEEECHKEEMYPEEVFPGDENEAYIKEKNEKIIFGHISSYAYENFEESKYYSLPETKEDIKNSSGGVCCLEEVFAESFSFFTSVKYPSDLALKFIDGFIEKIKDSVEVDIEAYNEIKKEKINNLINIPAELKEERQTVDFESRMYNFPKEIKKSIYEATKFYDKNYNVHYHFYDNSYFQPFDYFRKAIEGTYGKENLYNNQKIVESVISGKQFENETLLGKLVFLRALQINAIDYAIDYKEEHPDSNFEIDKKLYKYISDYISSFKECIPKNQRIELEETEQLYMGIYSKDEFCTYFHKNEETGEIDWNYNYNNLKNCKDPEKGQSYIAFVQKLAETNPVLREQIKNSKMVDLIREETSYERE